MAEHSKIEWCDHTFNPWMGCTRVSPGCQHCYAETLMDHRYKKVKWGPEGVRVRTSEAYWKKPEQWNHDEWFECSICGWRGKFEDTLPIQLGEYGCPNCKTFSLLDTHQRVFCASLADVFENKPELEEMRDDLFHLIKRTPNLDWLLLTKRPENVMKMVSYEFVNGLPENVWIGTSVENQQYADARIPELLKIPAKVRFLSCEPLLGKINLSALVSSNPVYKINAFEDGGIHWVIVGGESGPQARPMHPDWVRNLRGQCLAARVPFFFKQWGEYVPNITGRITSSAGVSNPIKDHGDMVRVGKIKAGRLLDGQTWNQMPLGSAG